jgi:hypothetical protein
MWNEKRKARSIVETLQPSARSIVLSAHFGTRGRADRAAQAVSRYAFTMFVSNASGVTTPDDEAEGGFILTSPRVGALLGALAGFVFMALSLLSRWPALAGDPAAMRMMLAGSFLVTGLCGAAGWLAGVAAHAFAASTGAACEVRALVSESALDAAEQVLRSSGAQTVWVLGDETMQPVPVEVEADYFD